MPQCCRCNGSGRCANCVCAKAKKPCTSCLPGRKARCSNTSTVVLPCPAPPVPPSQSYLPPGTVPCEEVGPTNGEPLSRDVDGGALPRDVSSSQSSQPGLSSPLTTNFGLASEAAPQANGGSIPALSNPPTPEEHRPLRSPMSEPTIQPTVQLPEFSPMANPEISWGSHSSESFTHSFITFISHRSLALG